MMNKFLIAVLILVASLAVYAQFFKPKLDEVLHKRDYITELEQAIGQAKDIQTTRDALLAEISSIDENKKEIIQTAVPEFTSENVIGFLIALDRLFAVSGLPQDTYYDVGESIEGDETTVLLPITFKFDDIDYSVLLKFISNIQNWDRGIRINELNINSKEGSETNNVSASFIFYAVFSNVELGDLDV